MSLPVKLPKLPDPPPQYDPAWFQQYSKTLELYFRELNNAGALRGTTINLSHLPTSATGLRAGDLWNNLGVVNIV